MSMKEFSTAVEETEENEVGQVHALDKDDNPMWVLGPDGEPVVDEHGNKVPLMMDPHVRFMLNDRLMRAFNPTTGQAVFMMSALGRGQSQQQRTASIISILMEAFDPEDKDYFEGLLITRDAKTRLRLPKIEGVFSYVTGEWFGRPTQESSDSPSSAQTDGPNSMPTTTPSLALSSGSDPIES